jgi:hypothetical protein
MIAKYHIEYGLEFKRQPYPFHYKTDDPVECEEFLTELLEKKFRILDIKHEGVSLDRPEFDRMIKTAASMMAANHICASLGISVEEERFRFKFSG